MALLVSYTHMSPGRTYFFASASEAAPMSTYRSSGFTLPSSSISLQWMTPFRPLAKRTGVPTASFSGIQPILPTRSWPSFSMWVTIRPRESIWAANMIFLPGPFLWQIRLPMTSVVISSQYGFASFAIAAATSSSQPLGPKAAFNVSKVFKISIYFTFPAAIASMNICASFSPCSISFLSATVDAACSMRTGVEMLATLTPAALRWITAASVPPAI